MAKTLVIYNNSDNSICGYARVAQDQDAKLYPPDPQNQTVIEIPMDHPAFWNQPQYKIASGQLVQKNVVQLAASAPSFPADGTSTVDLTFTGLNAAATVQVGGQAVTVSPTDNVITLSADAPQTFNVQLVDEDQWSNAVTVEAQ